MKKIQIVELTQARITQPSKNVDIFCLISECRVQDASQISQLPQPICHIYIY